MKKITLFLCLLVVSLGYSQTNLEDFEGTTDFTGANNLGGANVTADPVNAANMVGEIISSAAGDPWQQADLVMQSNFMDLSTNITVQVDVYSTASFTMMARVDDTANNTATSATAAVDYTGGSGWQTMTFTFNEMLDGQGSADGEYNKIAFFPNWAGGGSGTNTTNPDWNDPLDFTLYVDNITAIAGSAISPPAPDPEPAPIPLSTDGNTYSIYNDTNGYSTTFPFAYDFGTIGGEPDLDTGAAENKALQFNFNVAGYGAGEGGPDDISSYGFVSFDYWAAAGTPGFRCEMISNDGGVAGFVYEVGTDEAVVNEAWTKVVIPMSHFTNLGFSAANFFQWKFDPFMQSVAQGGIVYIDNFLVTQGNPLSVDNFETTEFRVFPNPTNSEWNISGNSEIKNVAVYDILGKRVLSMTPNSTESKIDATALRTGVYFARIEGANGSKTIRLVRE